MSEEKSEGKERTFNKKTRPTHCEKMEGCT